MFASMIAVTCDVICGGVAILGLLVGMALCACAGVPVPAVTRSAAALPAELGIKNHVSPVAEVLLLQLAVQSPVQHVVPCWGYTDYIVCAVSPLTGCDGVCRPGTPCQYVLADSSCHSYILLGFGGSRYPIQCISDRAWGVHTDSVPRFPHACRCL